MKMPWLHGPLMIPFGGDDDNGGGGIEYLSDTDNDDGDETIDGDEEEVEDEDEDDDDEDDVTKGVGFDQNALVQGLVDGLSPILKQKDQPRQMSREDIERQLGKPTLTVDLIKLIRDPDTPPEKALEAFNTVMNLQQEYLLKASGFAINGHIEEFRPQVAAVQAQIQAQQQREFANGVVKKFPALKGRGNVVAQAIALMTQKGYKPASQTAAKRDVATVTAKMIKQIDPSFSLKPKNTNSNNQFLRPQVGGRGSNNGGGNGKKSLIDTVFGPPGK